MSINSNALQLKSHPPPTPFFPHLAALLMNIDNLPPAVLNGNAVKNDAGCVTHAHNPPRGNSTKLICCRHRNEDDPISEERISGQNLQ